MKIYKNYRDNYSWEDYIDGVRVRRENVEWKTRRDVKLAYDKYMSNRVEGELDINPYFSTVIQEFINVYSVTRKRSSVIRIEYLINAHILPYFGKMRVKSITLNSIQTYQKNLIEKKYLSNGEMVYYTDDYLKSIQVCLRSIFRFAVQHQYLVRNPLETAQYASRNEFRPRSEFTILSNEQYEHFMEGITNPGHRIIFSLLYWCGLRSGELMALSIYDIDVENAELHVYKNYDTKNRIITTTKTNKDRFVDIPDKCIADIIALKAYAASENIKGNFHIVGLNSIMSKTQMDRLKAEYIKLANENYDVPYFTYHELRHTHVSTLLDLGLNAKDIADRLGHSVEMVNNTYGHLFPRRKKELMNKLNSL